MAVAASKSALLVRPATALARQSIGAMFWGAFIAVAPFEILVGGAIVWLPLLLWRERARARHYGFWPGFVVRAAVVIAIMVAAMKVPKHDDVAVGPLSYQDVQLCELCIQLHREHGIRASAMDDAAFEERLSFSTREAMPRRAIVAAIAEATNREVSFAGCMNGASFLGGKFGTFYLHPKRIKADDDSL